MRKVFAVFAVAGSLLALPQVAHAGGISSTCEKPTCSVRASVWGTHTINVDADSHGSGTAEWVVEGPNGYRCSTTFPAQDPPRSWTCFNAPEGTHVAKVTGPQGPTNVGLRW
ncbi:hypothetical protein AB5J62_31575 [Amycolatopsis sp. cg5]|uniref:hypothetical protein n=1 Tax=Amycolatopsis sp. cg5 TaxID=3238802 RepID=UPI003526AB94